MVRATDGQRDRISCEFSRRRSGVAIPAPVRTCPFESGLRAGKSRPGADDRESAGSASHRARRDGLSMHAGRLRERRSTGDAPNHCDRGLPAAACGDRSFFYPVFSLVLVPATGRCRRPDDQATTFHARRNAAAAPRSAAASPRTASWPVLAGFAAEPAGPRVVDFRTFISARSGPASRAPIRTRGSARGMRAETGAECRKLRI